MSDTVYRRNYCRKRDSPRLELALDLSATPVADAYVDEVNRHLEQHGCSPELYRCAESSFLQLLQIVILKVISLDYIYETIRSLELVKRFEGYAADVVKALRPAPQSLIVDIGSNDGTLLKYFKAQNLRAQGTEPAMDITKRAKTTGVDTIAALFNPTLRTSRADGKFILRCQHFASSKARYESFAS